MVMARCRQVSTTIYEKRDIEISQIKDAKSSLWLTCAGKIPFYRALPTQYFFDTSLEEGPPNLINTISHLLWQVEGHEI